MKVSMKILTRLATSSAALTSWLALAPTASLAQAAPPPHDRASLVNPLIGTANGGNVFPGATAPFGMVQFSPEATPINAKRMIAAPGGYEIRATKIRGFSLTNVEGWGCAGGSGDVPLMPVTSPIDTSPSADFRQSYSASFTHADERAEPGSYQVKLSDGIEVQLAAGTRIGAATFRFPPAKNARVLVRTSDSEVGSTAATTHIDQAARTVSGSVTSGNFCGYIGTEDRRPYYTLHFVARFSRPITETGAWRDTTLTPGAISAEGGTGFGPKGFPEAGHGSGVWLGFGQGGQIHEVRVQIGISYVSEGNALLNLNAEVKAGPITYEAVAARTRSAWNRRLGQIETIGGTPDQQTVFTTALYHALQTPTTYSDANGEYRGMDGAVHKLAPGQAASTPTSPAGTSTDRSCSSSPGSTPPSAATSRRACSTSPSPTAADGIAGPTWAAPPTS